MNQIPETEHPSGPVQATCLPLDQGRDKHPIGKYNKRDLGCYQQMKVGWMLGAKNNKWHFISYMLLPIGLVAKKTMTSYLS